MAGDWISVQHVTPDKPEVFVIAESLNIDPNAVVGALVRIWIWADQQSYDGDAGSVTLASLDRLSCCPGLGKAMLDAGWLERAPQGFIFPHFDRYNGQTAKRRALTTKRNQVYRAKERDAHSVTEASPEKRREENTPPPLGMLQKVPHEKAKTTANKLHRTMFPKAKKEYRAPPQVLELIWEMACLEESGVLPAAAVRGITDAASKKLDDRPQYLKKCIINQLKERGLSYDSLRDSIPPYGG